MNKSNYFNERDAINAKKLSRIISDDLPTFCEEFFIGIESNTATLTRLGYAYDLRIFFKYVVDELPKFAMLKTNELTLFDLEKLQPYDIERYINYLSYYVDDKSNVVRNTQRGKARKLSSIRSLFKYFIKKSKLEKDPTISVSMPKIHDKEIIRLEENEINDIIDIAESGAGLSKHQLAYHKNTQIRDMSIVTLLLGTGIRVSELVGINIEDVDFDNMSFLVTRKGGNRTILYFSDEVAGYLYEYFCLRDSLARKGLSSTTALFLSLQNKRITTRAVENIIKKYSKIATPLKNITPHKLRSTFGTQLYRKTGDIYIVADVLGHKDVNTTKKHYAAISDSSRRNASTIV
ncbi:MAG: tyrosine-type recombinase/integrase, partial [Clostridia bacterium]